MSAPVVVEVVRSGIVESEHLVDVAVVDGSGALVAWAGDPARPAAFRSSAKPIQARVARACGWEPSSRAALAIACASHNGEPEHVAAVREVLGSAGLAESALRCPPALPFDAAAARAAPGERPIFHNCSGKHAGMLAASVAAGFDPASYADPAHPLQMRIHASVTALTGVEDPPVLVDGCGVPTVVAPLAALALGFLRIDDGGEETAAMRTEPALVAGTARLDSDLMRAEPALCAKGGAEGLMCVTDGRLGLALKSRDGTPRFRGPATVHVLAELGVLGAAAIRALDAHRRPAVLGGDRPVGALGARGSLARA